MGVETLTFKTAVLSLSEGLTEHVIKEACCADPKSQTHPRDSVHLQGGGGTVPEQSESIFKIQDEFRLKQ